METETAGVPLLLLVKEEQQECGSSLDQEGPEPPLIKEEPDEEELDQIKEEATRLSLIHVVVKSEDDGATSSWTQHVKTEADGDTCGGAEPALLPDHQGSPCSESDTDDSEDWRETSDTQTGSNSGPVKEEADADHTSLICSGCGKKCFSKSGLALHSKSCCCLTCSLCGKRFDKRWKLRNHMRVHSGEKPFICSQCGKCCSEKGNLTSHMRIHSGEKPFICSECGRCFSQMSALKSHRRVHTGEKRFFCFQCGKWFSEKDGLKKHMRVHTGEKPFICSECGKCFSLKGNLKIHLRVHTGEKPFICSQCGKGFAQKAHLNGHMRVHTGDKPL